MKSTNSYDLIIIASDYYKEIYDQLTKLNVDVEKIAIASRANRCGVCLVIPEYHTLYTNFFIKSFPF